MATVLIVEDSRTNAVLLERYLQTYAKNNLMDLSSTIVENGRQAVEYAAKNNYNLILMDLQLPVMDGFEATKAIRKNSAVPIIAISALEKQALDEALEAGCSKALAKPLGMDTFYNVLDVYLK